MLENRIIHLGISASLLHRITANLQNLRNYECRSQTSQIRGTLCEIGLGEEEYVVNFAKYSEWMVVVLNQVKVRIMEIKN